MIHEEWAHISEVLDAALIFFQQAAIEAEHPILVESIGGTTMNDRRQLNNFPVANSDILHQVVGVVHIIQGGDRRQQYAHEQGADRPRRLW